MKNVTLAIDEDVLAVVRRYASDNNTSVNALIREAMQRIAKRCETQQNEWDELFNLADEARAEVGPVTWTRDDLHDR